MKVVDIWLSIAISRENAKSNFKRKEDQFFFQFKDYRYQDWSHLGVRHCLERVKNPISEGTMSLQEPFLHDNSPKNCFVVENVDTLQGTNISPKNGILKMIFLFPRWDMLIPWRVCFSSPTCFICFSSWSSDCRRAKQSLVRHAASSDFQDSTLAF